MKKTWLTVMMASCCAVLLAVPACKTDQEGVKSTYRSQYKTYDASVEAATDAAEAVLSDLGLKDVEAESTKVDGQAIGMTADDTKVTVSVARVDDDTSEVSVYVGKLGDPELGKSILADIDAKLAE